MSNALRSSMAACFALMGDPWTAQRLLTQLATALQAMPKQAKLEAKARVNLAWICLQAARMARDAADRLVKECTGWGREWFAALHLLSVDEEGVPVAARRGVPVRWDGTASVA